jgi:hypothetical protein
MAITLILTLTFLAGQGSVIDAKDVRSTALASLFANDEAILSNNIHKFVEQLGNLPVEQRFEQLSLWVLPSSQRSGFRTDAEFLQTDPVPGSVDKVAEATHEGILSPCFALIRTAEQSGKLGELRQRLESIPDPAEPHQLRAKLALLLMVQSAQHNEEAALEVCNRLVQLVRVRGENLDGQWWPETLALAWGMQEIQNRTELLELAVSIYDTQIGHSNFSGNRAWDTFVAGSYARLQIETSPELQSSDSKSSFGTWQSASIIAAITRGCGSPTERWISAGATVHKATGHENDCLYFPVPLTGDFEINCDVSGFNYREAQVTYHGFYATPNWRLNEAELGGIRDVTLKQLNPPITHPDTWMTCRIAVKDGLCRHFISGRLIHERTMSGDSFPWLALRSYRLSRGSVRNLMLTGTPSIPDHVAMIQDQELNGWFSYFAEPVADPSHQHGWLCKPATDGNWELSHPLAPALSGTDTESLLLYHRPMMEDGVIEYEFFCEPGTLMVHPAIDRQTFLIEPDGVKTHWITDGKYQRLELLPENKAVSDAPTANGPVRLLPKAWNKVTLSIRGDDVEINLNGESIFRTSLNESSRRQFGLFHFVDRSQVRVRNMRWTGEWSKSIDPDIFPPASLPDVAAIDKIAEKFPKSYHYDFRDGSLPGAAFVRKKGMINVIHEGVRLECSSDGPWQQTDLSVSLEIGGDFDLRASFRDLEFSAKGNLGAQFMATMARTGQEIRIARNRWDDGPEMMKFQTGSSKVHGRWEYADTWTRLASPEGVFRLVRISDKLHYLFAESETSGFRLLHTDRVGTENLRLGDTSLSVFAHKSGTVKCVWTGLDIRAEQLSGTALLNTADILSKLNAERAKLPVHRIFDFEKAAPELNDFDFDPDETIWSEANKGLVMKATGQAAWTASLLGSRQPLDGDFDVTLNVGETDLILPADGQFSTLMWQVQQLENDRTRFASMFRRTPTEYKAIAQQHRTLPDGRHDYTWHGDVPVNSVASLRIARRGKVYTMLLRPVDAPQDEVVHQTEHAAGPIVLHTLLHSGAFGKDSRVLLRSIEIHAAQYWTPE